VDVISDGGNLVLRASSSSVESPGFLAAYSAHVIRPPFAPRRDGDDGSGDETGEHGADAESEAASVERWTGTGALDPAAQAIRSLQVSYSKPVRRPSDAWHLQKPWAKATSRSQAQYMQRSSEND